MDEWTGKVQSEALQSLQAALASTIPDVLEELAKVGT